MENLSMVGLPDAPWAYLILHPLYHKQDKTTLDAEISYSDVQTLDQCSGQSDDQTHSWKKAPRYMG